MSVMTEAPPVQYHTVMDMDTQLELAGARLARARKELDEATALCRQMAVIARRAGLSDVRVAKKLGVSRQSARVWVGKETWDEVGTKTITEGN